MKTATLKCGCKYEVGDRERWLTLCPEHDKETRETHERWAREHHARVISGTGNAAERRELDALNRGLRND